VTVVEAGRRAGTATLPESTTALTLRLRRASPLQKKDRSGEWVQVVFKLLLI
jgi:hypothetical protein